jgi:hypothetical protein
MRTLLIALVALTFVAAPAFAATIFNKPNKDNALPDPMQQEQPVPDAVPAPTPTPVEPQAQAAPETIEDFADRYNENCMKKKDPILRGEPLRMLCACSAAKLQEKMTVDEVKTMMTDTPEGLGQRNRMAVHVYAPCMEYPTRALLYHNCKSNKDVLSQYKNAETICTCMADDMAKYIAANGQAILAQKLMENPNDPDPLGGLMSSEGFQAQTQNAFMACVARYPITP